MPQQQRWFTISALALLMTVGGQSIGAGQTGAATLLDVQGTLDENDSLLADGSLFDVHQFEGQAGDEITVTVESTDFDTYLIVADRQRNLIAENDDIGPTNRNSAATFTLRQEGTYLVIVNSYDASGRGDYRLVISSGTATARGGVPVIGQGPTSGGVTAAEIATARPGFTRHEYPGSYSIEYPEGWLVDTAAIGEGPGSSSQSLFYSRQPLQRGDGNWPADLVKTEVYLLNEPFTQVTQRANQGSGYSDVIRRGELTVGGLPALRIWTERHNSVGIHTYIQYANGQTAVIHSYFSSDVWIDPVEDMHWSFRPLN